MRIHFKHILLLLVFGMSFCPVSIGQLSASLDGRIESEYKLSVPKEIESEVWQFLQSTFTNTGIKTIDTTFSVSTSREIFYDQYFDNKSKTLYQHKAGARFRQRYVADSLVKELLQLKLPMADSTGVARREIKFNVYKKIKNTDRKAMHPFWRHVRPKHRDNVNLHLANLNLTGEDLTPAVKVRQDRQRIYVLENGAPFLTMTFDEVRSFYFPYPQFTELELELNEIKYTDSSQEERQRMEEVNQQIKDKILKAFPALKQDQTPKYNKMYNLLKGNIAEKIYSNLVYIIFGGIVVFALFLLTQQYLRSQKILRHANSR